MADNNPKMMRAFDGVYLIEADVDSWNWQKLPKYGFNFKGIPIFYVLDAQGNPTGKTLDGNAWGTNTPSVMAPVFDAFFHPRDG